MNNCYKISNTLTPESFNQNPKPSFNNSTRINSSDILVLINNLNSIIDFWANNQKYFKGGLVQINFKSLLSKSKRLEKLCSRIDMALVGAHFIKESNAIKHAMVYYFSSIKDIEAFRNKFVDANKYINAHFAGFIDKAKSLQINGGDLYGNGAEWNISFFLEIGRIESFSIPKPDLEPQEMSMVHFYLNPDEVFKALGINVLAGGKYNDRTILLRKDDLEKILGEAPYFVASGVKERFNQPVEPYDALADVEPPTLPNASNEPIVGVIDTAFNTNCYLAEQGWVDYHDLREPLFRDESSESKSHGTGVSSLIVCGDRINEELGLYDGCGLFRVRHFAVANKENNSTLEIMKNIAEIVRNNKDIKVWNLSLGTETEVNKNYISPVAALLDELQAENDIIFIVAGTNNKDLKYDPEKYRIGSPADSVNSLVVNSVQFKTNEPASYSRSGPVLDFFIKPDVAYYGGDINQKIRYYNGFRIVESSGTSFAAPLVARKLAYLIYKVGLSKEAAKALIIDAASNWDDQKNTKKIGRGIVPVNIQNILKCPDDEIRFVYSGTVLDYNSFDNSLPMPLNQKNKSPFVGRAVMCYSTTCSPDSGVDYTDREVDIKFGPVVSGKIKPIKPDFQYEDNSYINEAEARKVFSKWDNVKRIKEPTKSFYKDRDVKDSGKWGFKFVTTYRNVNLKAEDKYKFTFGVVVTLKSVDGKNRSLEFLKLVQGSTWRIEVINIDEIEVFNETISEDIDFSD